MKTFLSSLSILLVSGLMNLQAQATGDWSSFAGTGFALESGDGTSPQTAFLINAPEQLAYLAQEVNMGNSFQDLYFRLTGNIDLKAHHWIPIGDASNPFEGHFNGSGYRIENLYIDDDALDYAGLFGYISQGSIDSLAVVQSTMKSGSFTGAIAGKASNISIKNSYGNNMITGENSVGGLVGYAENILITDCYADGVITAVSKTGGLCGEMYNSVITHSYATATITITEDMAGGLAGYVNGTQINNCVAINCDIFGREHINRIIGLGEAATIMSFNYAFSGMRINQSLIVNDNPDNENGCDTESQYFFSQSFYAGDNFSPTWDFNQVWQLEEEQTYPYFTCQSSKAVLSSFLPDSIGGYYNTEIPPDSIVIFCNNQRNVLLPGDFSDGTWTFEPNPALNVNDIFWITVYELGKRPSEPVWGFANPFSEGIGTEEFPFGISTPEELDAIRTVADKAYYFVLLDDIDLQEYENWNPIGNMITPFKGCLDGDGHLIKNLTIESTDDNLGLFGVVNDGKFENLFLSHVSIKGNNCVGGISGQASNTVINNSFVIADIEAGNMAGSFVGKLSADCSISHVISVGVISLSGNYGGGIAGQANGAEIKYSVAANTSITGGISLGRIAGDVPLEETDCNYFLSTFRINGQKQRHNMSKSLSTLQSRSFYEDADNWDNNTWDFSDKWQIEDNLSYPYFASMTDFPMPANILPFSGGNGTKLYPYLISTAGELDSIHNYADEELYYRLISDIDLSSFGNWVGTGNNTIPFEGYINGAGHIIKNLTVNYPDTDFQGLFGYVQYSSIDSLGLINANITGRNNTGGFAGIISETRMSACFAFGKITGENKTGGLTGEIFANSVMENCYFSGDVSGNDIAGGLTGGFSSSCSIDNVYAQGSVNGQNNTGALTGQADASLGKSYSASMVRGKSSYKMLEESNITGDWIAISSYYPQLKVFAESDNNIVKASSALSAVPILLNQDIKADSVCYAIPLPTHNAAGDTISWESGISGAIKSSLATTLQPNFQQDTLIVTNGKTNLSKRIYFAPYHIEPELNVEVQSGGIAYTGEWTNQDVVFSLSDKKDLISGASVVNDSIWNGQTREGVNWKEIPAQYILDRDTSILITFKPVSKANITGEKSEAYTVKIDKTPPELNVSFTPADMSLQEQAPDSVVFNIGFFDPLSGIKTVSWETIGLENEKTGKLLNSNNSFKLEDLGSYQVKILATDSAGNTSIRLQDVYVREKRRDSTLVRLVVNNEEIRLRQGVSDYAISPVSYSQASVDVIATTTDKFATSDNQGNYLLNAGETVITITTYAEEREITGTYRITVYRQSNDASLAGLNVGGKNIPVFAGQYSYNVDVSSTTQSVEPVYLLNHPNAVCDIQSKYYLGDVKTTNEIVFNVTAEDPAFSQEYRVNVYRQNNVNTLQTLQIAGVNVPLKNETTSYTVVVPATTASVTLNYTLNDDNSVCDALMSYELTGQETEIIFFVFAEDRNVKQEYRVTVRKRSSVAGINTITVNGKSYSPEDLPEIALDCSSDTGHFEVIALENGTVNYSFNGKNTTGSEYDLTLPGPGRYEFQIIIVPEDNTQPSRTYPVKVVKWFGDNIFFSRWKDVLAVRSEVNGYTFERVEWYKEGENGELSGNPSAGYIRIPQEGNYYAILEGRGPEGTFSGIRSCNTVFQFSDVDINVYPNPARIGQQITITANMPATEMKNASFKLLTFAGVFIVQGPLKGKETKLVMPTTPGTYILQVITGSGITREFKIIVQ